MFAVWVGRACGLFQLTNSLFFEVGSKEACWELLG